MKLFHRLAVLFVLLTIWVTPAYAQGSATKNCSSTFTLLPCTDKTIEECQETMNEYGSTGTVPLSSDTGPIEDYSNAKDAVDEKSSQLNEAKDNYKKELEKLCQNNLQANDKSCEDFYAAADPQKSKVMKDNIKNAELEYESAQKKLDEEKQKLDQGGGNSAAADTTIDLRKNLLGCAIKTGRISLSLAPYFITYIINFLLAFAGLIAVLFIVIGGYLYVFAGLTEDKDKGKKTIKNALLGMVLALMAWSIVNVVLSAITG